MKEPAVDNVLRREWISPQLSRMKIEETLSSPSPAQGESNAHSNGIHNGNVPGGSYS